MDVFNAIVKFFQEGGVFMYPIMLVFALGAAIAIERYLYLSMAKLTNRSVWNKLTPMIKSNNFDQAMALASRSKAEVGKILAYGLSRLRVSKNRDDIEIAMEEGLMEVIPRLEKRTHYLATFANIATLLGEIQDEFVEAESLVPAAPTSNPASRRRRSSGIRRSTSEPPTCQTRGPPVISARKPGSLSSPRSESRK